MAWALEASLVWELGRDLVWVQGSVALHPWGQIAIQCASGTQGGKSLHGTLQRSGHHASNPRKQRACNPSGMLVAAGRIGLHTWPCLGTLCTNRLAQHSVAGCRTQYLDVCHKHWLSSTASCQNQALQHQSAVVQHRSHGNVEGTGSSSSQQLSNQDED